MGHVYTENIAIFKASSENDKIIGYKPSTSVKTPNNLILSIICMPHRGVL